MAQASLKPNTKMVLLLIVFAVTIFFCVVLAYMAAAGKMRSLNAEMVDKQKQVAEDRNMALKLEESRLKFTDASSQLRFLESSISTAAYVPTLLKQIEFLGKSVDLKVLSIRPQPAPAAPPTRKLTSGAQAANGNVEAASQEKPGPGGQPVPKVEKAPPYDQIKVELEVEGKYMNALDFLYKLTTFPKIVAVNSVQMSPKNNMDDAIGCPNLSVKVNFSAFVLKKATQTQSADSDKGSVSERRSANASG